MPKQKKQPRNAYYFFITEKRAELERNGQRFRNIAQVFELASLRDEWKELGSHEKLRYEALAKQAKEADRQDLTNKFATSGESYAQLMEQGRQVQEKEAFLARLLEEATMNNNGLTKKNFILIKTIYFPVDGSVDREYWPVELALATFTLEAGFVSKWWTLVNTRITPQGYASAVKEMNEDTALPTPGSSKFWPEHSDYARIVSNIRKFILHYLAPIQGYYCLFVLHGDETSVEGCLNWLHNNTEYNDKKEEIAVEDFLKHLKFLKVSRLLMKLASAANQRTPSYTSQLTTYGFLDEAANRWLCKGDYDFKESITCSYHNQEDQSNRMSVCCLNVVIRSIFLVLQEVIPHLKIDPIKNTHSIDCVRPPAPYIVPTSSVTTTDGTSCHQPQLSLSAHPGTTGQKTSVSQFDPINDTKEFPGLTSQEGRSGSSWTSPAYARSVGSVMSNLDGQQELFPPLRSRIVDTRKQPPCQTDIFAWNISDSGNRSEAATLTSAGHGRGRVAERDDFPLSTSGTSSGRGW